MGERESDAKSADGASDQRPEETERPTDRSLFIVGIGASAGGLEALQSLFDHVPDGLHAAFVVVQHLAPDFRSLMPELLRRHSNLAVNAVKHGERLQPGHVYLIPPARNMIVSGGRLFLSEQDRGRELQLPIDLFLRSLAHEAGPSACAVILSGTGSDGTRGIVHVAEAGGQVLVQQPETAAFDGMPRSAIRTGCAHFVLPTNEIGAKLGELIGRANAAPQSARLGSELEELLRYLSESRGVDLRRYRKATLWRRLDRRMHALGIASVADYRRHVEIDANEPGILAQEIMIGVTRFFRDEEAFKSLREHVVPRLIDSAAGAQIRVWTPGCATGEETYSLAMAIEECARERGVVVDYKIFATDIDPRSLAQAARGTYPAESAEGLGADLVERYFSRSSEELRIAPRIRERIVFARQDVAHDAPFTRIDLVICRNLLIYFEPEHQRRVLDVLHFALRPNGFLFLGGSKSLGDLANEFSVIDSRWKIYQKVRESAAHATRASAIDGWTAGAARVRAASSRRVRDSFLEAAITALVPQEACLLLVDTSERVLHTFGEAATFLSWSNGPTSWQLSRIVEGSVRTLAVSAYQRALRDADEVAAQSALSDGKRVAVRARVVKRGSENDDTAVVVMLQRLGTDVQAPAAPSVKLDGQELMDQRIRDLDEQLLQTREVLQSTIEELEASNEELQATNEELLAANEELHGTNEELQSVNEELYTVNQEHQAHIQRLAELGDDMDLLLESLEDGTILLDENLLIRRYTPSANRNVRLMNQDVGRSLEHLRHELVDVELCDLVREVLRDRSPRDVLATTHGGRFVRVRVRPYASRGGVRVGAVLSFVDVDKLEHTLRDLSASEERFRELAAHIHECFWMYDLQRTSYTYISPRSNEIWGLSSDSAVHDPMQRLLHVHPDDRTGVEERYAQIRDRGELNVEYRIVDADGAERWILDQGFPVHDESKHVVRIAGLASVITASKQREERLVALAQALENQANNDPLTGLLNRRGLSKELARESHRVLRSGTPVSAVLIDCDNFKRVNDVFGHSVGDGVLTTLAQKVTGALRGGDLLARVGGDEFLVVLPDTRMAEAMIVAERIRLAASSTTLSVGESHVNATVSLGVVAVSSDMLSIEEIVTRAHGALERSKRSGKNRVSDASGEWSTSGRVLDAIQAPGVLTCVAQRIVELNGRGTRALEFLSRCKASQWANPTDLFRAAVEQDTLTSVDLFCMRTCVEAAARAPSEAGLHFNLYPSTLVDVSTPRLLELFRQLGDPRRVCIEISEQQFLGEPTYLLNAVEALRQEGVRVALDDVGFGRSSLESLLVLRPEVVKLDRSLVHGVHRENRRRATLRRLMSLLQSSESMVIAEGVEDPRDAEILGELRVELAQGYYFGEPAPL